MKVILSRKGFDSSWGGYPSPVFDKKMMLSLPIPVENDKDGIEYSQLVLPSDFPLDCLVDKSKNNYFELINMLYKGRIYINGKSSKIAPTTKCHADPDLQKYVSPEHQCNNEEKWKGMLGQMDAAQLHLNKQDVTSGDLFLFFGRFRHVMLIEGRYNFSGEPFHAIWGYLQIDKVIPNDNINIINCYHPHNAEEFRKNKTNTIYTSVENLTFADKIPGAGVFNYSDKRVLTNSNLSSKDRRLSRWKLPDCLKTTQFSYHLENTNYGLQNGDEYFQSVPIGQEFVSQDSFDLDRNKDFFDGLMKDVFFDK